MSAIKSKAIVYSLFGYGRGRRENCFNFDSYLRGLAISIRLNLLVYPEWVTVVELDVSTYSAYRDYFNALVEKKLIEIEINEDNEPLCKAMLWRLKPIFWQGEHNGFRFTHIICRDLDSPVSYKEAQAVQVWIEHDKCAHAITDSDSHSIPMMGGMVGFRPEYITTRMGMSWDRMVDKGIDYSIKGSDQDFLNRHIYPTVSQHGSDSITQHYFEGMPKTYLSDFHTCSCPRGSGHRDDCSNNVKLAISEDLKITNDCSGHIGCAGWYEPSCFKVFDKYRDKLKEVDEVERKYNNIFKL